MPQDFSHLDEAGRARMVDVSAKAPTARRAVAEAYVHVPHEVMEAVRDKRTPKGNVFEVARLAGIMAAKRTGELIPLCHTLPLDHVAVDFEPGEDRIRVVTTATARAPTGVEMEALTGASAAALTLYDMLKGLSRAITIEGLRLLEKTGGKSGDYRAPDSRQV